MNKEQTFLSVAITIGDIAGVKSAVKGGADINYDEGVSLIEAIFVPDLAMVNAILELGANPNLRNGKPLLNAINMECTEIVRALLAHGANPNADPHTPRESPLHLAAFGDLVPIVHALIDAGSNEFVQAIEVAICFGHLEVLKAIKERGIAVQAKSQDLIHAINTRQDDTVLWLLLNGHTLTEQQVEAAVLNELHQVINHLTYATDYLPTQRLYDRLNGDGFGWFLHGIANRELNKRLNNRFATKTKAQVAKI